MKNNPLVPYTRSQAELAVETCFLMSDFYHRFKFGLYPVFYEDGDFCFPAIDRYYSRKRWIEIACNVRPWTLDVPKASSDYVVRNIEDIVSIPACVAYNDDAIVAIHFVDDFSNSLVSVQKYLNACNNTAKYVNNLFFLNREASLYPEKVLVVAAQCLKPEGTKTELVKIDGQSYQLAG